MRFDVRAEPYRAAQRRWLAAYVTKLLRATRGNLTDAADRAGVARKTLYALAARAGVDVDRIRHRRKGR